MKNIYCPSCGVSRSLEHSFCLNCGTEIKYSQIPFDDNQYILNVIPSSDEPSMSTVKIAQPTRDPKPLVAPNNQIKRRHPSRRSTKVSIPGSGEKSKKNKARWRIPIIVIVLLIFGSVTFTINVYQRSPQAPGLSPSPQTTRTPVEKPKPSPIVTKDPDLPPEFEKADVVTTTDSKGNTGEIGVGVLKKSNSWEKNSRTRIMGLGDLSKLGKDAFSQQFQDKIRKYPEVAVAGTSDSRMTPTGGQKEEIDRSYDRGTTLFFVAEQIRGDEASIKLLNLGQWKCSDSTAYDQQRRIIILWVVRSDNGFNLKEGLHQALETLSPGEPLFQDMLNCYTNFDLS